MAARGILGPTVQMAVSALTDLARVHFNADSHGQIELMGETGQNGLKFAHSVRIQVSGRGRGLNGGCGVFYQ